eukprot:scaffold7343_cov230-Pinguiococcus_pyrenoidosus.AAC.2
MLNCAPGWGTLFRCLFPRRLKQRMWHQSCLLSSVSVRTPLLISFATEAEAFQLLHAGVRRRCREALRSFERLKIARFIGDNIFTELARQKLATYAS